MIDINKMMCLKYSEDYPEIDAKLSKLFILQMVIRLLLHEVS